MKKIMINGMMCEHCAAHVREALEALGGKEIEVNLDGGYAVADISCANEEITAALDEEGYAATGFEEIN